jgi:hypothetical protein
LPIDRRRQRQPQVLRPLNVNLAAERADAGQYTRSSAVGPNQRGVEPRFSGRRPRRTFIGR